jgi:F-type H+-transporting ATPase subunit alpha
VKKALAAKSRCIGFLKQKYADLINKIETTKDLDADSEQKLAKQVLRNSRTAGPD